jgi:hypothetical protein
VEPCYLSICVVVGLARHRFVLWESRQLLLCAFFSNGATAPSGPGLPHHRGFIVTLRHTTLGRTPVDNTQHSKEIDIHVHDSIRTHNPSKRRAVDPCLRPRGHWDRHFYVYTGLFMAFFNSDVSAPRNTVSNSRMVIA